MFRMARVRSNGKFKMKIDQAEVVNDNSRKLPKVLPKDYESVH